MKIFKLGLDPKMEITCCNGLMKAGELPFETQNPSQVLRENTAVPCAIGFGISTPEQAAKMAGIADGAIVGSAVIKLLEQYRTAAPEQIGAYVKRMKDAVRG